MTTWSMVLLTALAAMLAYLAFRFVSLGARRSIKDLEPSIKEIQRLSDPRISLMIREFWRARFLQFRSIKTSSGKTAIELWLPRNGWSEDFHPWIVDKCIGMKLGRKEFTDAGGRVYTVVSFDESTIIAAEFASELLMSVFGLKGSDKVSVRIDVHQ